MEISINIKVCACSKESSNVTNELRYFFIPRSIKILLLSEGNMMKGCVPTNHIDQFKARLKEASSKIPFAAPDQPVPTTQDRDEALSRLTDVVFLCYFLSAFY